MVHVANLEAIMAEWPQELDSPPRHITNDESFPMRIAVDEPRRVGIDRLLNAVAVQALRGWNRIWHCKDW